MANPFDISNQNQSLKYLGSAILGWKDKEIRKLELVVNSFEQDHKQNKFKWRSEELKKIMKIEIK